MLNILKTTIQIGLTEPIKVLHTTDTHLTLCDDRDNNEKMELAERRKNSFKDINNSVENLLEETIEYGKKNCDMIIHTGDLIDFVSEANIDKASKIISIPEVFFVVGNHEYSLYVGEAWEDHAYRMNTYMRIKDRLGTDLFFSSKQIKGLNFVGIDNIYYHFEEWYIERLKIEINKGLPIILLMHNPIFEESLYDYCMNEQKADSAGIVGCDEEHLLNYPEYRALQQRPDEPTLKFIEFINNEPSIKAIIAGHLHFSYESKLPSGKMQYITGGGYDGIAREITIL